MVEASLTQKLNIKPYSRIGVLNAPDTYELNDLPDNCTLSYDTSQSELDCVQVFVNNRAELDSILPTVVAALKPDGMLWVAYPKGSSKVETDLNRDRLWAYLEAQGWEAVRQISVNDMWSALRFKARHKPTDI